MGLNLNELLTKWAKMTDENRHTEVCIEIAAWFAGVSESRSHDLDYEYTEIFKSIAGIQLKDGCLSYGLSQARSVAMDHMMDEIKNLLGDETYSVIRKAL